MRFQNVCWLMLCLVFLSACGNNATSTAKLTLTANPTQVVSGGKTILTATIDEGADKVVSVEFAVKDQDAFFTDNNAEGGYTTESPALNVNTTFVAVAKDAAGTTLGSSSETPVTVTAAPAQPNAEAKTVTTLAGVQVVGGGTPTGLAVATEKLVAQNGNARLKGTATGGTAVVNADGTFTFTPDAAATSGSFEYEVFSTVPNTTPDSARVTINITALPATTKIVNDFAGLTAETSATSTTETIILGGAITCDTVQDVGGEKNCVVLKPNQKLFGSATVASVALTNPNAKLLVNLTGDNIDEATAIKLAKGVTIEGLEVAGEAGEFYTAIRGIDSDFLGSLEADRVTIKNVKIVGPTLNNPIGFRLTQQDSTYNLTLDGVTIENATKTLGFSAFKDLVIKNSTFNITGVSGINGIAIQSEGTSSVSLENVKVNSSIASGTFNPISFTQADDDDVMTVTVKDTSVTFTNDTDDATPFDLTTAVGFIFTYGATVTVAPADGRLAIQTAASTGNSTNSTSGDAVKYEVTESATNAAQVEDVIQGYIQGTKGGGTTFPTRP